MGIALGIQGALMSWWIIVITPWICHRFGWVQPKEVKSNTNDANNKAETDPRKAADTVSAA